MERLLSWRAARLMERVTDYTVGLGIVLFQEYLAKWQGLPSPGEPASSYLHVLRQDRPS